MADRHYLPDDTDFSAAVSRLATHLAVIAAIAGVYGAVQADATKDTADRMYGERACEELGLAEAARKLPDGPRRIENAQPYRRETQEEHRRIFDWLRANEPEYFKLQAQSEQFRTLGATWPVVPGVLAAVWAVLMVPLVYRWCVRPVLVKGTVEKLNIIDDAQKARDARSS